MNSFSSISDFRVMEADRVFVTVTALGREVLNLSLSGMASGGAVASKLRELLEGRAGLLTVTVRNSTQGTLARCVVRMRPSTGVFGSFSGTKMQGKAA